MKNIYKVVRIVGILVSINCITYNHEKYIAEAIESFLMQETNFEFEIVIGEDCSTDNTRNIVQTYAKKYPEKIVLVTSEKNVGMQENERRIYLKSRGKYIADCEGDDYWTDPHKLQKQIDYMESHPTCTLCFHNANRVDIKGRLKGTMISEKIDNSIYDAGEIAVVGFIPTASRVYLKYTLENPPIWYATSIVGDFPSQVIITSQGYAYYMKEIMSVYRIGVENSVTYQLYNNDDDNIKRIFNTQKARIEILDNLDNYLEYKYTATIQRLKKAHEFEIAYILGDMTSMKEEEYKEYYSKLTVKQKIKIFIQVYIPKLYKLINRIYKFIKKKIIRKII